MRELRRRLAQLYGGSPLDRVYTSLKMSIIPFEQFSRYLPKDGAILEVGCGYGYVSNYLSLESTDRSVVGVDVAEDRVGVAQQTIGNRRNVEFLAKDCRDIPKDGFDAVVIADVLHHVPYPEQTKILADVYEKLKFEGVLVMRETDKKIRLRYFLFNYLLEWVLYLHAEKLNFRTAGEWKEILESVGFEVRDVIPNPLFFPYITALFVCAKRGKAEG